MSGAIPFSFDPNEFAGKRALVTGGTKGMGEAILRRLAAGGAKVATAAGVVHAELQCSLTLIAYYYRKPRRLIAGDDWRMISALQEKILVACMWLWRAAAP